jgi:hypothetical protein
MTPRASTPAMRPLIAEPQTPTRVATRSAVPDRDGPRSRSDYSEEHGSPLCHLAPDLRSRPVPRAATSARRGAAVPRSRPTWRRRGRSSGHRSHRRMTSRRAPRGRAALRAHHDSRRARSQSTGSSGTEPEAPVYTLLRIRPASRSQRATALAATTGHDGASGPCPHPQPKTVHLGTAPVVGLERPLALGHGCFSSMTGAPAPVEHTSNLVRVWKQPRYVRFVRLACSGA